MFLHFSPFQIRPPKSETHPWCLQHRTQKCQILHQYASYGTNNSFAFMLKCCLVMGPAYLVWLYQMVFFPGKVLGRATLLILLQPVVHRCPSCACHDALHVAHRWPATCTTCPPPGCEAGRPPALPGGLPRPPLMGRPTGLSPRSASG